MEDDQLIKNYLNGDDASFNELYEKYKKPLYSYIYKLSYNNAHLSDDIFQQTWMKIIDKLDRYSERDRFIYWAFTIARNLIIDNARKNKKYEKNIPKEALEENGIELIKDHKEPWNHLNNKEIIKAINSAIDTLPKNLKEVFILRNNDISFKEIAQIQNCSINTALSRMKYALNKLKNELIQWEIEGN